jgi:phage-related holin
MKPSFLFIGAIGGWWSGFTFRTEAEKILMLGVFCAVVADWVSGIAAAYKVGTPVTSSRMRQGITKIIGYFALVLIAIATAQMLKASGINLPQAPILSSALGLIFVTEALSVLENVAKLTGIETGWIARIIKGLAPEQKQEEDKPSS